MNPEIAVNQTNLGHLKVAIVHEWFVNYAGSERVVEQLLDIFPQAEVFSLVDFLPEKSRFYLKGKKPRTSFIQSLPFARKYFRHYFPLFPMAVEGHDLRGFDLIISSSHLAAKGVIISQEQLHICYCHSPCRFAWDLYHQYLEEAGLTKGLKGRLVQYFLSRLRIWDQINNRRVHHFIANSAFIAGRIRHVYDRDATVIYPPVDTEAFQLSEQPTGGYYFAASRFVPYKKMDLIVEAFAGMPDRQLIIAGSGPEEAKVQAMLRQNIIWKKEVGAEEFKKLMAGAKAFVFAAEEDFGITMAEAQATGTPVIAFRRGGAAEIVTSGMSGYLFDKQSVESIQWAIATFEREGISQSPKEIRAGALRFSHLQFKEQMIRFVAEKWASFQK